MKVMCIGQAAYDITIPVNSYPTENTKIRVKDRIECGGGSSSNAAYLLSKWGCNSYFAGVVGNDHYGEKIKDEFNDVGVNIKYLETITSNTTSSYIIANLEKGTRTILTNRPRGMKLHKYSEELDVDYIYLDGYEYEFAKKAIDANPTAIKVLDAGSMKEATLKLAEIADYIVCSHDFAEEYCQSEIDYDNFKTLVDIYDKLQNDFKGKIIITLEHRGVFVYDKTYKLIPSIKVKALDSTGAGDIFHAALVYFLSKEYTLEEALRLSNITGALSVTKLGARYSIPELSEVMEKHNANLL